MSKRPYNAPRRDEQARETRAAVLGVAHRLFVKQGYAATSIRQIAREARVAEQTVYRVFENKAALLREVLLTAVSGGDHGSTARQMKDFMARANAAATPADRLRVVAKWSGEGYERGTADLEEVVFSAADADPRIQELASFIREQRYQDVKALVEVVAKESRLPPGLSLDDVADYIYAVWSSPVYRQLVGERGWSTEKYIAWCIRLVERLFLDEISAS